MVRHSKKQQIAKQLGVSLSVLEQYLQLKRAEVTQESARLGQSDDEGVNRTHIRNRQRGGLRSV